MRRSPLPLPLQNAPFSTSAARGFGVEPGRLRAKDLSHPFHGVHTQNETETVLHRCLAYRERMRAGQFFSHGTAAALYGMPLPEEPSTSELDIGVEFPRTPPRGRGVRGHSMTRSVESALDSSAFFVKGLAVCSPLRVWMQLAATMSREDLVAIGDFIVGARRRMPLAEPHELRDSVARAPRGTKRLADLRWSAERVRFGADSRPESLLRLAVVDAGFPEPAVNPAITMPGGRIVHPDLVFFRERVILEYEGDGHRTDPGQWMRDIRRHDAMAAAGWRVIRVTREDLFVRRRGFLLRLEARFRAEHAM